MSSGPSNAARSETTYLPPGLCDRALYDAGGRTVVSVLVSVANAESCALVRGDAKDVMAKQLIVQVLAHRCVFLPLRNTHFKSLASADFATRAQ